MPTRRKAAPPDPTRPETYWPEHARLLAEYRAKLGGPLEGPGGKEYRRLAGYWNPRWKGNEYLFDPQPGEVEIARVACVWMTSETTSIRARPEGLFIRYRVVDDDLTEFELPFERTRRPLSLEQLEELLERTWSATWRSDGIVWGMLDVGDFDPDDLEGSVDVSSEFYPSLRARYAEKIEAWLLTR